MKGLRLQIKRLEENIALKKKLGKDASQEEMFLKSWKRTLKKHPEYA